MKIKTIMLVLIFLPTVVFTSCFSSNGKKSFGSINYEYDDSTNTLTIYGKGDLIYDSPLYHEISQIEAPEHIIINENITSIQDYFFSYQAEGNSGRDLNNFNKIKSIEINSTLTQLNNSVFAYCSDLEKVILPEGVTTIGELAFYGCQNLKSISIPESVNTIGGFAFGDCSKLEQLELPPKIENIPEGLCDNCYSLKSICIPLETMEISSGAFSNCSELSSVTFNDKISNINENAFYNCKTLSEISLPNSIENIGDRAFLDCYNLPSISIPLSVKQIGAYAFGYSDSEDSYTKLNDFSIKGYANSAAQTYAQKNGFTFTELN